MFGAARFWRSGLSVSRSFGFHITPRGMRGAPRGRMPLKCFKERWIFRARASARRVMRIKRLKRRAFSLSSARKSAKTAFGLPQRA
jgi:hypothetical protein